MTVEITDVSKPECADAGELISVGATVRAENEDNTVSLKIVRTDTDEVICQNASTSGSRSVTQVTCLSTVRMPDQRLPIRIEVKLGRDTVNSVKDTVPLCAPPGRDPPGGGDDDFRLPDSPEAWGIGALLLGATVVTADHALNDGEMTGDALGGN